MLTPEERKQHIDEAQARYRAKKRLEKVAAGWMPMRPGPRIGSKHYPLNVAVDLTDETAEQKRRRLNREKQARHLARQRGEDVPYLPRGLPKGSRRVGTWKPRQPRKPQDPVKALARSLKFFYGITLEDFRRLLDSQDGKCAICRQPPRGLTRSDRRLHVDHDHRTGAVRGLLCTMCNRGIGCLGDDADALERAAAYLRAPRLAVVTA